MKALGWYSLLLAGVILATGCQKAETVEETRDLELPASTTQALNVGSGFGDLHIVGDKEASSILAKASIKRSGNVNEEDIIFTLEQEGDSARLVLDDTVELGLHSLEVSLTVTVPQSMSITVEDGSGDIEIKDTAGTLIVHDDSGDMEITNAAGEVEIYDQSGDLHVSNASNIKRIEDESGDSVLKNTSGDMEIHDESGNFQINNHNGDIAIWDESGDILIDGVNGDVTLEEKGSGNQTLKNINGSGTEK
jgi:DUF4097 and DUF4098 domain-containing protein YvlB